MSGPSVMVGSSGRLSTFTGFEAHALSKSSASVSDRFALTAPGISGDHWVRREAGCAGLGLFLTLLGFVLEPAAAQGLPEYHPNNPVVESRSGIYFQPFVEPKAG